MGTYKYKAFISYSHRDDRWGRWLHKRLENYPLPKNIVGNVTKTGEIPKRLKPIFRDREELAAADNLGDKIEQALENSENLIMICSPQAARSHWVNQEVLYFKRHNRGAQIFCVIVEGEPFASNMPGREDEECFPPALRYQLDEDGELSGIAAEPLAADLRDHADGKRLGVLKLVSGMIGVGLDEVVQRDMRRGRRRVTAITTGALTTVLAMGTLTGFALDARAEAELAQAEAEAGRNDAEESIEFMLTDLKKELEPVGRLSTLKVVGERAEAYYDKYPISKHSDEALGRRARVFHYLGEIQGKLGSLDEADKYFKRAYDATEALLEREIDNPDRIFDHAQSSFYVGYSLWKIGKYSTARPFFDEYINHAEVLNELEPDSLRGWQEITYAYTNLGILLNKQSNFKASYELYKKALPAYKQLASVKDSDIQRQLDLINAYGWLADAALKNMELNAAYSYRIDQSSALDTLLAEHNNNFKLIKYRLAAVTQLTKLSKMRGNFAESRIWLAEGLKLSNTLLNQDVKNLEYMKAHLYIQILRVEELLELGELEEGRKLILEISFQESLYNNKAPNDQRILENVTFPRKVLHILLDLRQGNSAIAAQNIKGYSNYLHELPDANKNSSAANKFLYWLAFLEFLESGDATQAIQNIEKLETKHDLEAEWMSFAVRRQSKLSKKLALPTNKKPERGFYFNTKILGQLDSRITSPH